MLMTARNDKSADRNRSAARGVILAIGLCKGMHPWPLQITTNRRTQQSTKPAGQLQDLSLAHSWCSHWSLDILYSQVRTRSLRQTTLMSPSKGQAPLQMQSRAQQTPSKTRQPATNTLFDLYALKGWPHWAGLFAFAPRLPRSLMC